MPGIIAESILFLSFHYFQLPNKDILQFIMIPLLATEQGRTILMIGYNNAEYSSLDGFCVSQFSDVESLYYINVMSVGISFFANYQDCQVVLGYSLVSEWLLCRVYCQFHLIYCSYFNPLSHVLLLTI